MPVDSNYFDGYDQSEAMANPNSTSPRQYLLYNLYNNVSSENFDVYKNAPVAMRNAQYKLIHAYTGNPGSKWYKAEGELQRAVVVCCMQFVLYVVLIKICIDDIYVEVEIDGVVYICVQFQEAISDQVRDFSTFITCTFFLSTATVGNDDDISTYTSCSQASSLIGVYETMLFDLVNDPYETTDLFADETYADVKVGVVVKFVLIASVCVVSAVCVGQVCLRSNFYLNMFQLNSLIQFEF